MSFENLYNLSEITVLTETGDIISSQLEDGQWLMKEDGRLERVGSQMMMAVSRKRLNGSHWYFLKKVKRCPHCGGILEES